MDTLQTMLPFVKILLAFVIMLGTIRLKLPLWTAVLLGACSIALFYGLPVNDFLHVGVSALVKEKFLFLLSIVGLILILSDGLERSGQSQRLMDGLTGYLSNSMLRLVFFPALIGLLPMPGGAVFSAPMVKAVSRDMDIDNTNLAVINYWFRHVWELAWPLYPGIILTVALADIPIFSFISKSWPGILAMFTLGWFFILRPLRIKETPVSAEQHRKASFLSIGKEAAPLLIAIVGAVGLETMLAKCGGHIPFEWGVIIALVVAAACVMLQNRLGLGFLIALIRKKSMWNMLAVVAAIFIFKDTMTAANVVTAMAKAGGEKSALLASALLLPFLVGMVAGINVAFVGSTFPLLLGMLKVMNLEHQTIAYLVLATFAGFTGVMISPIHICFMLTCEYFQVDIATTWKKIVFPCIGFALTGIGVFYFLL